MQKVAKRDTVQIQLNLNGQKRTGACEICAFGAHYDVKQIVVVDEDVGVHDPQQVERTVVTRFQADRDLIVISDAQDSLLDPSSRVGTQLANGEPAFPHRQGISAKTGLDATKPVSNQEHAFTKVRERGEEEIDLIAKVVFGARVDWLASAAAIAAS